MGICDINGCKKETVWDDACNDHQFENACPHGKFLHEQECLKCNNKSMMDINKTLDRFQAALSDYFDARRVTDGEEELALVATIKASLLLQIQYAIQGKS